MRSTPQGYHHRKLGLVRVFLLYASFSVHFCSTLVPRHPLRRSPGRAEPEPCECRTWPRCGHVLFASHSASFRRAADFSPTFSSMFSSLWPVSTTTRGVFENGRFLTFDQTAEVCERAQVAWSRTPCKVDLFKAHRPIIDVVLLDI
jgi:hypothetical protein